MAVFVASCEAGWQLGLQDEKWMEEDGRAVAGTEQDLSGQEECPDCWDKPGMGRAWAMVGVCFDPIIFL